MDSDFNSGAITDVVLVADTDVADFALAAGGEKGVICAQCGAGPSSYPPSDASTIRVINGNAEVWLFRGARSAHNCLVGGSSPPRGVRIKLIKKCHFLNKLRGLAASPSGFKSALASSRRVQFFRSLRFAFLFRGEIEFRRQLLLLIPQLPTAELRELFHPLVCFQYH